MSQFDVVENPIPRARRALPFVILLQADLADTGAHRVVAPLAPESAMPPLAQRLIPIVSVESRAYALLVPSLTAIPAADLHRPVANLAEDRDRIMAALDYLFFGV